MAAAAARKRGRDDDDGVEEAVELLAAAMSRESDVKLSAMSALQRLIDPGDEAHAIQRRVCLPLTCAPRTTRADVSSRQQQGARTLVNHTTTVMVLLLLLLLLYSVPLLASPRPPLL